MPRITPYLDQFWEDRRYGAADPEGHLWYFARRVRDVDVEDMKRQRAV